MRFIFILSFVRRREENERNKEKEIDAVLKQLEQRVICVH